MPYALPALSTAEHHKLTGWLASGAIMPDAIPPSATEQKMITRWENLLNGSSAKEQLINHYLFEHLYLVDLYFDKARASYFKLVRSSTPSSEKVVVINTRRPFDSPYANGSTTAIINKPQMYYRLIKHSHTIIAKRYVPCPFGEKN
jgi:hypothetical protein